MPALRVHHTETSEAAWDGPANKARLRLDENEAYYRSAYAWQDPDGDERTKAAYKFIHHFISDDGTVGAASTVACSAGIAVLNGARGGTTIPAGDVSGVYSHLAAHLRDADLEPPELTRGADAQIEEFQHDVRALSHRSIELRQREGAPVIAGYAAVFNELSDEIFGERERVMPGAFTRTLSDGADVRALFNHDPNFILGRTPETLILSEDTIGLAVEIRPPDTATVRDLVLAPMRRGDLRQMSFGFIPTREAWVVDKTDPQKEQVIREIREVKLIDVAVVTFPAYRQTEAHLRHLLGRVVAEKYFRTIAATVEAKAAAAHSIDDALATHQRRIARLRLRW